MKRRELKPGTFFRYLINPVHVYWVPEAGVSKPPGVLFSGPNPASGDWDFEVHVLEGDELAAALKAEAERHAAVQADEAVATEAGKSDEHDEEPEA